MALQAGAIMMIIVVVLLAWLAMLATHVAWEFIKTMRTAQKFMQFWMRPIQVETTIQNKP